MSDKKEDDFIRKMMSPPAASCCYKHGGPGPTMPVMPPMHKACGVCPPCPASCNANAPQTVAQKDLAKVTVQLCQTEENFKTKVTECAMLRSELMKTKQELEKERCMHREVQNKLRETELRMDGLNAATNMMLGTKEQALENEVNVRTLKRCYREARDEIDELRKVLKEQNEQLQDYRVKYIQNEQLVTEQKRQMDLMELDNSRISEQINMEVQRVKLKFQEKLQELAPIPELLKATQMKLKDAQQAQALAEHNAEQLARELVCAREKVHSLLHNAVKPAAQESTAAKGAVGMEEKQINMLQTRVTQLTETNAALKAEIERLKANVVRAEEMALVNERRLQDKMQECAQLGAELDNTREEAALAVDRVAERIEINRKCLQTTIAELERQLAATRGQLARVEKEREEVQQRMRCQIKRLRENFEQAQMRVLGLCTQVSLLSSGNKSSEINDMPKENCMCKTLFNNP